MNRYPFFHSGGETSGVMACMKMIFKFYGRVLPPDAVIHPRKTLAADELIHEITEANGLRCIQIPFTDPSLPGRIVTPCVIRLRAGKYIVLYEVKGGSVVYADPENEVKHVDHAAFIRCLSDPLHEVAFFLLERTPRFYARSALRNQAMSLRYYLGYIRPYRKYLVQILFGLMLGSLLQFLPPFLTQVLVDRGVGFRDVGFVNLILVGLILIQLGKVAAQLIREWINFYISSRIEVAIVSEFINHVMRLPLFFFGAQPIGDILQRIGDHKRIQNFLTQSIINMAFGFFSVVVFGCVLAYYSWSIFFVFAIASAALFGWGMLLLSVRKRLDVNIFKQNAANQSYMIQILQGIQEIKLQGIENEKRWEWERNQVDLYKSKAAMLKVDLSQNLGSVLINEIKNIVILFLSARLVISGELTLGMMLAIQYILGQASQPVLQFVKFLQEAQMAVLSLRRLAEVNEIKSEQDMDRETVEILPGGKTISLEKVTFSYPSAKRGSGSPEKRTILQNINLRIPEGKITGIVGPSGCGKTTLVKMLLKFYFPDRGEIKIGNVNLNNLKTRWWRQQCGTILQDSYLFNDTVLNNVAEAGKPVDMDRFLNALKVANIADEVEAFPKTFHTRLGPEGYRISHGQRQRMLIARLVYRNPQYIFMDEATNSLDAQNEQVVLENLVRFFAGKTILIITHSLHVARYMDNLIIMDNGSIVEFGNPQELMERKGAYFKMVSRT